MRVTSHSNEPGSVSSKRSDRLDEEFMKAEGEPYHARRPAAQAEAQARVARLTRRDYARN